MATEIAGIPVEELQACLHRTPTNVSYLVFQYTDLSILLTMLFAPQMLFTTWWGGVGQGRRQTGKQKPSSSKGSKTRRTSQSLPVFHWHNTLIFQTTQQKTQCNLIVSHFNSQIKWKLSKIHWTLGLKSNLIGQRFGTNSLIPQSSLVVIFVFLLVTFWSSSLSLLQSYRFFFFLNLHVFHTPRKYLHLTLHSMV